MNRNYVEAPANEEFNEDIEDDDEQAAERLLASKIVFEHEKLWYIIYIYSKNIY